MVFRGLVSILLNFREELYSISPFSKFCFIEVSPTRFLTSVFFIIRIYLGHWPTVKIFSILVKFLLRYSNFSCEKTDSPEYHTPGSKFFYPSTFLQKYKMEFFNSKIRINIYFFATVPLKAFAKVLRNCCWLSRVLSDSPSPRGHITRGDWLSAVWYPGEIHKNSNNEAKS